MVGLAPAEAALPVRLRSRHGLRPHCTGVVPRHAGRAREEDPLLSQHMLLQGGRRRRTGRGARQDVKSAPLPDLYRKSRTGASHSHT